LALGTAEGQHEHRSMIRKVAARLAGRRYRVRGGRYLRRFRNPRAGFGRPDGRSAGIHVRRLGTRLASRMPRGLISPIGLLRVIQKGIAHRLFWPSSDHPPSGQRGTPMPAAGMGSGPVEHGMSIVEAEVFPSILPDESQGVRRGTSHDASFSTESLFRTVFRTALRGGGGSRGFAGDVMG